MKSWKWMGVLVLGALLAVGCGGDDDDDDGAKAGKGGSGSAGKAGSAGKPDNVLDIPDGGIACGAKNICTLDEGEENVTLCCADAFAGTCGMMQGTQGCVKRVSSFPGCPSAMGGGGMFRLPSCCTDDGQCGINGGAFTGGDTCTELGAAAERAAMMGAGMFITFPPPQACP